MLRNLPYKCYTKNEGFVIYVDYSFISTPFLIGLNYNKDLP